MWRVLNAAATRCGAQTADAADLRNRGRTGSRLLLVWDWRHRRSWFPNGWERTGRCHRDEATVAVETTNDPAKTVRSTARKSPPTSPRDRAAEIRPSIPTTVAGLTAANSSWENQ